jgi:hypothetical protein
VTTQLPNTGWPGARSSGGRGLARPVVPGGVSLLAVLVSTRPSVMTDAASIAIITATAKSTMAVRWLFRSLLMRGASKQKRYAASMVPPRSMHTALSRPAKVCAFNLPLPSLKCRAFEQCSISVHNRRSRALRARCCGLDTVPFAATGATTRSPLGHQRRCGWDKLCQWQRSAVGQHRRRHSLYGPGDSVPELIVRADISP